MTVSNFHGKMLVTSEHAIISNSWEIDIRWSVCVCKSHVQVTSGFTLEFTELWPCWKRYWEDSTITGKCCGRALKAAGCVENDSVIRIRATKKWVAGARIQAQSTGGRCMDRALINTWGRMKGQIVGEWVGPWELHKVIVMCRKCACKWQYQHHRELKGTFPSSTNMN